MNAPPGNILVSGASGLIGAALLPALVERGYQVVRLVRRANAGEGQIAWDPAQPLRPQSVSGFEAVVHLAGESVVGRWTEAKKRRILESRVQGTRHLAEALAEAPLRPRVLVSASAIGYYGNRGDEVLTEDSPPGQGFLPEVCGAWERAAEPAERAGIRTVQLRIGIVLSRDGGALQKMLAPFRLGAGGNLGNGRQWWSWIDVRDLVGAIVYALTGSAGWPRESGVAPTGYQSGVHQDTRRRALPTRDRSDAGLRGASGLWADGGRTPAGQPEGGTGEANRRRIFVRAHRAESRTRAQCQKDSLKR